MADSLVLKGVKDIRKQTGTEFLRVNPSRGGDTHQIKRWWTPGTVNTVYEACTLLRVTQGGATCFLALPTEETSSIRIDVADGFLFDFYDIFRIKRAALLNASMNVIEHYAFPSISGGKIMTVTPPGAPDRPDSGGSGGGDGGDGGGSTPTVTVSGPTDFATTVDNKYYYDQDGCPGSNTIPAFSWSISDDSNLSYWNLLMIDEDADNFTHWSVTNIPAATVSNTEDSEPSGGTVGANDFGTQGYGGPCPPGGSGQHRYTLILKAMDSDDNEIASGSLTATIDAVRTVQTAAASADVTHVVTQAGGDYYIDGVANAAVTANAGETIYFDLSSSTLSGHPFAIYTDSSKTTNVSVGIETSDDGDILLFTPPIAGTFSYQCTQHANMGGDITVS